MDHYEINGISFFGIHPEEMTDDELRQEIKKINILLDEDDATPEDMTRRKILEKILAKRHL